MAIYEPTREFDDTGVYSGGVGKDSPYGKAPGLYNPKFSYGRGKARALFRGAQFAYNYVKKYPRFSTRIGAVGVGAGVRYASTYQKHKALLQSTRYKSRKRYSRKYRTRGHNRRGCHTCITCGC